MTTAMKKVITSMTMMMMLADDSDNATLAELRPWKDGIASMAQDVIGRTLVKLEGNRQVCRRSECNMGQYCQLYLRDECNMSQYCQ